MSWLDDEDGIRAQFRIWGYALTGHAEVSAMHAERPGEDFGTLRFAWDGSESLRERWLVCYGRGPSRHPKEFAVLPWIGEHLRRGLAEWPGL